MLFYDADCFAHVRHSVPKWISGALVVGTSTSLSLFLSSFLRTQTLANRQNNNDQNELTRLGLVQYFSDALFAIQDNFGSRPRATTATTLRPCSCGQSIGFRLPREPRRWMDARPCLQLGRPPGTCRCPLSTFRISTARGSSHQVSGLGIRHLFILGGECFVIQLSFCAPLFDAPEHLVNRCHAHAHLVRSL